VIVGIAKLFSLTTEGIVLVVVKLKKPFLISLTSTMTDSNTGRLLAREMDFVDGLYSITSPLSLKLRYNVVTAIKGKEGMVGYAHTKRNEHKEKI